MTTSNTQTELREKLVRAIVSYDNIKLFPNDTAQHVADNTFHHDQERDIFISNIQSIIHSSVTQARISEWHALGNWNADKGIAELWPVIEARLTELKKGTT